jgi:hypothetical protein
MLECVENELLYSYSLISPQIISAVIGGQVGQVAEMF